MLTFIAIALLITGLSVMKTWPIFGFLIFALSLFTVGKAMRRHDDIEAFMGVCLVLCGIYSIYLFAAKLL